MAADTGPWSEVDKVLAENRRELVLTGESVTSRLKARGGVLDDRIFSLVNLNFLDVSKVGLQVLSDSVSRLENLTKLSLNGNALKSLPASVGQLKKLKFLNVSFNQLESFPKELGSLKELQGLNVCSNRLAEFISIAELCELHVLDVSNNELVELPPGIDSEHLTLLATVAANANQLASLPADLSNLVSLKQLDVSDNKLEEIPAALCDCAKLKEFKFGGNRLKDKRLAKMSGDVTTKAVLDYLRNIRDKELKAEGKKPADKDKKKPKKKGGKQGAEQEVKAENSIRVLHFKTEAGVTVLSTPAATEARPFIVCCVVRNLNFFKSLNMFKRFIMVQTKLHDTICAKRQTATIATHDLESIKGTLIYDARSPADMKLVPLGKRREVSAAQLVQRLRQEAEALRKENKRNTVSGIHKYLELVKGKALYPCLVDGNDSVISFPPITNCNLTKVQKTTRHILIEVTSPVSLDLCKKVTEALLEQLLRMGVGQSEEPPRIVLDPATSKKVGDDPSTPADNNETSGGAAAEDGGEEGGDGDEGTSKETSKFTTGSGGESEEEEELSAGVNAPGGNVLIVEQVKVVDQMGALKVVFPSRVDLKSEEYDVVREVE